MYGRIWQGINVQFGVWEVSIIYLLEQALNFQYLLFWYVKFRKVVLASSEKTVYVIYASFATPWLGVFVMVMKLAAVNKVWKTSDKVYVAAL